MSNVNYAKVCISFRAGINFGPGNVDQIRSQAATTSRAYRRQRLCVIYRQFTVTFNPTQTPMFWLTQDVARFTLGTQMPFVYAKARYQSVDFIIPCQCNIDLIIPHERTAQHYLIGAFASSVYQYWRLDYSKTK